MTGPAEFLAARLTEVEAVAQQIKAASRSDGMIYSFDIRTVEGDTTTYRKVKVYNPEDELRLVAATRAIVESCESFMWDSENGPDPCAKSVLELLATGWGWEG